MTENAALVRTIEPGAVTPAAQFDPFSLMDRMDEEALARELQGIASSELVYVVKDGGQEVVGLSKVGVDECCMVLVAQGQVIREESLEHTIMGEGEDREALFKVRAARYAVSAKGDEVRLDQVLGVKRQPLYYDAQQLSLDSKCPGKKFKGLTYREVMERTDGREYLAWMAENFSDQGIREFVGRILQGEDVTMEGGRKLNPHWYEAGAMKACRNARFRLIPGTVRAQIIASARQGGQAKVVETPAGGNGSPPVQRAPEPFQRTETVSSREGPYAPTDKQVNYYKRLVASSVFTEEEKERALDWLEHKATRQTIRDQLAWLQRQVSERGGKGEAAE